MSTLHITNGDSSVAILRQAEIPGDFLPWRDVLHVGPVPEGLSLRELSSRRADFIIAQGWAGAAAVRASFAERDSVLEACGSYAKVMLWFEHDLYDQLQILQILDWFDRHLPAAVMLTMICTDRYLGMLTPEAMRDLLRYESAVTPAQMALARQAWAAFRAPTPQAWFELLSADTSALPFLRGAVLRLLEEYPSTMNGLSRTANTALALLAQGEQQPESLFAPYQDSEERRFLGDTLFWGLLRRLLQSTPPALIASEGLPLTLPAQRTQRLSLTPMGEALRAGCWDWLECESLDEWIGGVHLTADNGWRWDTDAAVLVRYTQGS